MVFLYNLFDCH